MENGWTATKEALPPADEKVLIISKWGHVSDGSLVAYDPKERSSARMVWNRTFM